MEGYPPLFIYLVSLATSKMGESGESKVVTLMKSENSFLFFCFFQWRINEVAVYV